MMPSRPLKTSLAQAALACVGLFALATPSHAGLLANGSVETLLFADGVNCPGVPLGQSCVESGQGSQGKDGLNVSSLFLKSAGQGESGNETAAAGDLTVAFPRDAFASAASSSADMDAASLNCLTYPEACGDKLYTLGGAGGFGAAGVAGSSGGGGGSAAVVAGVASSAFNLGFMQSVGGVQVSAQYGLTFLQGSSSASAKAGDAAGNSGSERWQVTYGSSSQPAEAVTSVEGVSAGWSSSGLQFQGTSATQVQTYMASGPSGLMGSGAEAGSRNGTPWPRRSVPEPSVLLLAGLALAGLWVQRRLPSKQA